MYFFLSITIIYIAGTVEGPIVDIAAVEAAGRIFWGVAFTLAIIKTIKVQ